VPNFVRSGVGNLKAPFAESFGILGSVRVASCRLFRELHFLTRLLRAHPTESGADDEYIQKNGNQGCCHHRAKYVFRHQARSSRHLDDYKGKIANLRKPGGYPDCRGEGVAEDPNYR